MPLSINQNSMAISAADSLNSHYRRLSGSIRRLSSGLRVSSAADDAAGLAIRELMRSDVAAMQQGMRNANDAISLLQVADAALGIIDEKLIRMKELAEQAATGTYDSTQRLMINSEFQAMGAEIDRIARATDFNGIKLLDGSLSGAHNGAALQAEGELKIHFGTNNDSAEDYYYIRIADCTLAGLGLRDKAPGTGAAQADANAGAANAGAAGAAPGTVQTVTLNDSAGNNNTVRMPATGMPDMEALLKNGQWAGGLGPDNAGYNNFMFRIARGTKNIVINATGGQTGPSNYWAFPDNDLQLFTTSGVHLAGTPDDDYVWHSDRFPSDQAQQTTIAANQDRLPFTQAQYDGANLNTGPAMYDPDFKNMSYSTYNGMTIGYSGDSDRYDSMPNNGRGEDWGDYELLTIDEAKEDLIVWFPGYISGTIKVYWDVDPAIFGPPLKYTPGQNQPATQAPADVISIETQDKAQKALARISEAIVQKDRVRAHLGALQNRLENTVTSLGTQSEHLRAAESRISDADVAREMTEFVRNQILTQSAVAMLSQANSYPHMLAGLIT